MYMYFGKFIMVAVENQIFVCNCCKIYSYRERYREFYWMRMVALHTIQKLKLCTLWIMKRWRAN